MKLIFLGVFFLLVIMNSFSQESNSDSVVRIIDLYKLKYEASKVLTECGHIIDGPNYWFKQIENESIDALKPLTSFDEKQIGKESFEIISSEYKVVTIPNAEVSLKNILNSLIKNSNHPQAIYQLKILDSKEVNAFTTMGNYIYVTTGLLNFTNSVDEIAFILGHEIAHKELGHTKRRITKLWVSSQLLNRANLSDYEEIASNITSFFSAPFGQIDEYESDKHGFFMAKAAGYSTEKFTDFFSKMEKNENNSLLNKFLSTHPFPSHRKKCLLTYME